jgi:osmotically-inducible protein OsmY
VGLLDQIFSRGARIASGAATQGERAARAGLSQAYALTRRVANRNPAPKDLDDVTLARKVESQVFRDTGTSPGKVDVNAVDGVIWLRGEVGTPAEIEAIEERVRAVPEVQDVENLLHLPKAPARSARPGTRAKRRSKGRVKAPVNAELKTRGAESGPAEKAVTGQGRHPAPFGSSDGPAGSR